MRAALQRAGAGDQRQRQGVAEAHGADGDDGVGGYCLIQMIALAAATMKRQRRAVNGQARTPAPRPSHPQARPLLHFRRKARPCPANSGAACNRLASAAAKRSAASLRAARNIRRGDAVAAGEGGRRRHIDRAARGRDGEAVAGLLWLRAGKALHEVEMPLGLAGDDDNAGNARHAVGVLLKRRVPEILRIMLLAGEKADIGRRGIAREGERESDLHWRAVRPPCLAFEVKQLALGDAAVRANSATSAAPRPSRTSIDRPSPRVRKSRLKAPNEKWSGACWGTRSGSATVSNSMKLPANCTMVLCVPQGCRLRAPTVKPRPR